MSRIDEGFIREGEELVVERVVEMMAELLSSPSERIAQVWPADVADEERVAAEDCVWFVCAFLQVEDKDGDGFNGVARGFQDLETEAGKVECVAIFHGDELVLGFGLGAQTDIGATAVAKFEMAG